VIGDPDDRIKIYHLSKRKEGGLRLIHLPMWLSIIPPIIAIGLALVFKEVIISLFAGVWAGAFIAGGLRIDSFYYFLQSFYLVIEDYLVKALSDSGHLKVILFTLLIGGMVAVISRNGGMMGVVRSLSRYANSPKNAQVITWLLGIAIFFDDYANTLIVGNTMKSVTDRFKVSREKLAYLVDSTAAPVASIAFITTWIGAELGYIDGGMKTLSDFPFQMTPYALFFNSLKYSFYPILTLLFVLMVIWLKKDYGPMLIAERRARIKGQVSPAATPEEDEPNMETLTPVKGAPIKWQYAFFPVAVVILVTVFGLLKTGFESVFSMLAENGVILVDNSWKTVWPAMDTFLADVNPSFFQKIGFIIGQADSYSALIWGSLSGAVLALIMTLWNGIMKVIETMHTLITGFKTMFPALIILSLAWSLAITTDQLNTAYFLSSVLANTINPYLMPVLVFVLAAFISFSTGSSWSTMAILYPICIPTTWVICQNQGLEPDLSLEIMLNVISVVLGASVLGDHCSPISDTTILSSLASDCNHIDHVRTQLPYALTVGVISLVCCGLSTLMGGGWLISAILGFFSCVVFYFIVVRLGKSSELATEI
jgi:Na+/H+ antiporter NhaC